MRIPTLYKKLLVSSSTTTLSSSSSSSPPSPSPSPSPSPLPSSSAAASSMAFCRFGVNESRFKPECLLPQSLPRYQSYTSFCQDTLRHRAFQNVDSLVYLGEVIYKQLYRVRISSSSMFSDTAQMLPSRYRAFVLAA